ncbi:hypothetical protein PENTCL1PPCAC_10466, partial [Pristionchus entomophagus]
LGPIIGRLDLPDRLSVALVCHRLREVEKRTPRMEKAEPEIRSLVTNAPISDLPNGYYSFQIRWCEVNLLDWEFRRTATCLHHGNNRCHDFCRLRSATGQHIVPFASRDVGDVCLQSRSVDDAVPTALLTRVLPRSICANV